MAFTTGRCGTRSGVCSPDSRAGTQAGVLLFNVINNVINQVGTLSSYFQQVVSGLFLIIAVLVQRYLSREQRL